MIINFPSSIAGEMFAAIVKRLSGGGCIELIDSSGELLATLQLSRPAAYVDMGGVLRFHAIEDSSATTDGTARAARVLDAANNEVLGCDVGDDNSDSVIKFNGCRFRKSGSVKLASFSLSLP